MIATISSKLEAAIRVVGIPFLTPYPRYYKNMQLGTRTAGDTAAITKPIEKAREIGRSRMSIDIRAIPEAYTT